MGVWGFDWPIRDVWGLGVWGFGGCRVVWCCVGNPGCLAAKAACLVAKQPDWPPPIGRPRRVEGRGLRAPTVPARGPHAPRRVERRRTGGPLLLLYEYHRANIAQLSCMRRTGEPSAGVGWRLRADSSVPDSSVSPCPELSAVRPEPPTDSGKLRRWGPGAKRACICNEPPIKWSGLPAQPVRAGARTAVVRCGAANHDTIRYKKYHCTIIIQLLYNYVMLRERWARTAPLGYI